MHNACLPFLSYHPCLSQMCKSLSHIHVYSPLFHYPLRLTWAVDITVSLWVWSYCLDPEYTMKGSVVPLS